MIFYLKLPNRVTCALLSCIIPSDVSTYELTFAVAVETWSARYVNLRYTEHCMQLATVLVVSDIVSWLVIFIGAAVSGGEWLYLLHANNKYFLQSVSWVARLILS